MRTVPPGRIDILTGISGVVFEDAWNRRIGVSLPGLTAPVAVLSRSDFITNKKAAGRPKDLLDLQLLGES